MTHSSKFTAMAAGLVATALGITLQDRTGAQPPASAAGPETLVVEGARIDWVQKSNVAAVREGVIDRMELQIGMPVAKGKPIGYLKSELAALAVKKAQTMVDRDGPAAKAAAQKELAMTVVALNERLESRKQGLVSYEEKRKAEAELKVAQAMTVEVVEQQALDKVELELAKQTLEEHTIRAPFDGVVIERMKHEGEKVGQNEAVVILGNLNTLRSYCYIPVGYGTRVKEGDVVEFTPEFAGSQGNPQSIEGKRFRGKVTFVDPQVQPEGETAVRVYAEFDNRSHLLAPGLKGSQTIFLNSAAAAPTASAEPRGLGR